MTPAERLLDVVAFLLSARRPVPLREIFEAFSSEYAGNYDARERKFSRDKDELRALGIPLEWVEASDEDDEGGYRIDRARMYLPDIKLLREEKAALFAVGAAAVKAALPLSGEIAHALVKLRAAAGGAEEPAGPVIFAGTGKRAPFEELLVRAAAERKKVRLVYPPEAAERIVEPYAVAQRRGRFTLVGFCHHRQAIRTFHADRMQRCTLATPNAKGPEFELPRDFDPNEHLPRHPWQIRVHEPVQVELSFSPELMESGPRALGLEPGARCVTTNLDGLVSQVLALGPGVRITSPPEARARVREKLSKIGGAR